MTQDTTQTEGEEQQGEPETPPPTPDEPKVERSLVKLEADAGGVQAILPRDLEQTFKLAKGIVASGIVPRAFKYGRRDTIPEGKSIGDPNEPLIVMGIMKALEIGLAPLTGLSYLLPINDRFTIWGDAAVGLAQSKGLIDKQTVAHVGPAIEPGTELGNYPAEYGYEVRIWRRGQKEPYIGRFTVEDAKRAKLWLNPDKEPWIRYPDRMLFNRARAFALRDGFADAFMGLAIAEEARDVAPEPVDGGELKPSRASAFLDDEPEE